MLGTAFNQIYMKFKVHFYKEMFRRIHDKDTSLSTIEIFCVEIIYALGEPTINEFAKAIQISSPNAAYKINSLTKKGYIRKVQSTTDKREYHLQVTDKYLEHFRLSQNYLMDVFKQMEEKFPKEDIATVERVLSAATEELVQ